MSVIHKNECEASFLTMDVPATTRTFSQVIIDSLTHVCPVIFKLDHLLDFSGPLTPEVLRLWVRACIFVRIYREDAYIYVNVCVYVDVFHVSSSHHLDGC